jgi:hypothetical protein
MLDGKAVTEDFLKAILYAPLEERIKGKINSEMGVIEFS